MKKIRVQLTPVGHYFLGGERGFGYDPKLKRQMTASYFIRSLKVPSQTTLFGALRYIIGVENEKLKDNSCSIIGSRSFDITDDNSDYGIIKKISPLYLFKDNIGIDSQEKNVSPDGYYIRTPFDHINGYNTYHPMVLNQKSRIESINFPDDEAVTKFHPCGYNAKDGISMSYTCISSSEYQVVNEWDIFESSVEVVSRKAKIEANNQDGFAKKQYFRLNQGWSFVFFAELEGNEDLINSIEIEYNRSVVLGKDSSVFMVHMSEESEPDINGIFINKEKNFHYCQSPLYIRCNTSILIGKSSFSILESETSRRFKTEHNKLMPVYENSLIQMISPGSIVYSDDISDLLDEHAGIAGFNRIINGGKN